MLARRIGIYVVCVFGSPQKMVNCGNEFVTDLLGLVISLISYDIRRFQVRRERFVVV